MGFRKEFFALVGVMAALGGNTSAQSSGNDVYNFYFQKGQAPGQVIQGGGGQQAAQPLTAPPQPIPSQVQPEPPAPPPANNVIVAKPPEEKPVHDFKRFDILLGATRVADDVGTGGAYTFGGQVNMNRYLGVRAQAEILATESATYNRQLMDRGDGSNKWGGQAALVFTPLHMELLGHQLLKVSALGGIMSVRRYGNLAYSQGGSDFYSVTRGSHGFWGVAAQMTLNENVGIEGSVAMLDGGKVGQATADLVFSF